MTTLYINVTLGNKRASGPRKILSAVRGSGVASDVTVAVNTTTVTSRGDLIEACKVAAEQLLSDTVK